MQMTESSICKIYSDNHELYIAKRNEDGTYDNPIKVKGDLFCNVNEKEYEELANGMDK